MSSSDVAEGMGTSQPGCWDEEEDRERSAHVALTQEHPRPLGHTCATTHPSTRGCPGIHRHSLLHGCWVTGEYVGKTHCRVSSGNAVSHPSILILVTISCDALQSHETQWRTTGLVQGAAYHCHIPFIPLFPLFLFFPETTFLPATLPASLWAVFNVSFWQQSSRS